jgi:hypothetical protein
MTKRGGSEDTVDVPSRPVGDNQRGCAKGCFDSQIGRTLSNDRPRGLRLLELSYSGKQGQWLASGNTLPTLIDEPTL